MINKSGQVKQTALQTTLKLTCHRKDGGDPLIVEVPVEHVSKDEIHVRKAQLLMGYHQMGGIVQDTKDAKGDLDGGAIVYPLTLFEKIVIEANSIVIARPLVAIN